MKYLQHVVNNLLERRPGGILAWFTRPIRSFDETLLRRSSDRPFPSASASSRLFQRRPRSVRIAARLARFGNQPPVLRAQRAVAARPGVGARRDALGLSVLSLLQPHARKLLPQARIARLDAQRPLERGRS